MNSSILIINGPNLNLVGSREPSTYGREPMDSIIARATDFARDHNISVDYFQSNHEGEIIDRLHQAAAQSRGCLGIVLNAGAYTHTSLAIADAIRAISLPVVEVHLSNVAAREPIRHTSLIAPACVGTIAGFGPKVYTLAIQALLPA